MGTLQATEASRAAADKAIAATALFAQQQAIDGNFYAKKKEAEGLKAMAETQGTYLSSLLGALGGNYTALRDYIMITGGIYQQLAKSNAEAIQGLKPKISIWNNADARGDSDANSMEDIAKIYKMLPPLLKTVQNQTGMLPPSWMGTLPPKAS